MYRSYISFIAIIFFAGIHQHAYAQLRDAKEVLNKVQDFYKNKDAYQVALTYNMLKGLSGNTVTESYKGTVTKKGAAQKMAVLGSEVVLLPGFQLTVDHNQKTMAYSQQTVGEQLTSSPMDVRAFQEYYDQAKVREENGLIVCEMASSRKNFQLPYGLVILYINKNDYSIAKQVLYFSNLLPFVEEGKQVQDYGRLEVIMKHRNDVIDGFSLEDYVKLLPGNKNVVPQDAYKGYKLINQNNQ